MAHTSSKSRAAIGGDFHLESICTKLFSKYEGYWPSEVRTMHENGDMSDDDYAMYVKCSKLYKGKLSKRRRLNTWSMQSKEYKSFMDEVSKFCKIYKSLAEDLIHTKSTGTISTTCSAVLEKLLVRLNDKYNIDHAPNDKDWATFADHIRRINDNMKQFLQTNNRDGCILNIGKEQCLMNPNCDVPPNGIPLCRSKTRGGFSIPEYDFQDLFKV